jgi:phosphoribosyl 1,2-cyclic phosphodiesterase
VLHAVAFADLVGARTLALFHHDPAHDDEAISSLAREAASASHGVRVSAAREGDTVALADGDGSGAALV